MTGYRDNKNRAYQFSFSLAAQSCESTMENESAGRGSDQTGSDSLGAIPKKTHQTQPRQASQRRLDFQHVMKLASDNKQPSEVIRCLGDPENDLAQHLKENLGKVEYLELIIIALGGFCKKNGNSKFSESFVAVVKILAAQNIFPYITCMIINTAISRAAILPAKGDRLKRLTSAVFHLATNMLGMVPVIACQCLGQHFFTDIISLKDMPSIKSLNATDAFDIFEDGIQQLQTAWNKHVPVLEIKKDEHNICMEYNLNDLALQHSPNDPSKAKGLPLCGHQARIHFGQDPTEGKCPFPCDVRLDCGHSCTLNCHVQKDPDHQNYTCKKECRSMKQGCKKKHRCVKKCFEECSPCNVKWKRTLPCGHAIFTECHRNDQDIFCSVLMTKNINECGHLVELPCSMKPLRALCKEKCNTVLYCGHLCGRQCCQPRHRGDCEEPLKTTKVNTCGHHVTLSCKNFHEVNGVPTESQIQSHLISCTEPCTATLECGHLCKGTCGDCFNGRVHRGCGEKCGRSLVCGHICNVNCGLSCPPCRQVCEFSCSHSKCRHKCCQPCSPCKELCQWSCEHKTCTKRCGEFCNRTWCNEPCKKILSCNHSCAGLCGEICPPLCRVCDKDKLTEFTLLGNEDDEDAKFVFLPDCGHCIEVEGMDRWMETDDDGQIQPKRCPRCKTLINNCMRYGDIIKSAFGDIANAKRKILHRIKDDPQVFFEETAQQISECRRLVRECEPLKNSIVYIIDYNLRMWHQQIQPKLNGRKKYVYPSLGPDIRFLAEVNVDFLARALEILKNVLHVGLKPELVNELCELMKKLLRSLVGRDRISVNEYRAVNLELDRLEYVCAYFDFQSSSHFHVVGSIENQLFQRLLIKNPRVLSVDEKAELRAAMDIVIVKLRTGVGISDKEHRDIVQAMGSGHCHWFKCPNGHIYAIGECGTAMEESECNECHARIGGTDDRSAREMKKTAALPT